MVVAIERGVAPLHRLAPFAKDGSVHVVVECPGGANTKLKYDPELGALTLVRPLPHGIAFPFDFGFVPSTCADDGDPLDAMILGDAPTYPGVVVACRPVAIVKASQRASRGGGGRRGPKGRASGARVRNDRVICVARDDARLAHVTGPSDVPERLRRELTGFFLAAVAFEGKDVEILGWGDARAAKRAIDQALVES